MRVIFNIFYFGIINPFIVFYFHRGFRYLSLCLLLNADDILLAADELLLAPDMVVAEAVEAVV